MSQGGEVVFGGIAPSQVQGLLFDVDGTLSDTDDHLVARVAKRLKPLSSLNASFDNQHFARELVMAVETPANFFYSLADWLHLDKPISIVYDWVSRQRHAKKSVDERFWIIPGVKELLAGFSGRFPMAVVSARDKRTTLDFLAHFDLLTYFETVVTSQTCRHTKPFPDPIIYAAEQIGLRPDQCVMIGDTIVDIRAGKSAGAQTVGVLCGFGRFNELKRAGADAIVSSTADVGALFPS